MKCIKLLGLTLAVLFASTIAFAETLKIRGAYVSTEAVIKSTDTSVNTMKQPALDFEQILPAGGEIKFTRDIIFNAKPPYLKNTTSSYSYYEIGTRGYVGDSGNSSYFLLCDFELIPDKVNRRFLDKESTAKIASVYLNFDVNILGGAVQVNRVRINFANESLKSITCSIADNFTGFKSLYVTPELFLRGAKAFMSSPSFVLPKGVKL